MPLQATSGAASYDAFGGGVAVVPNYIEECFSTTLYTGNNNGSTGDQSIVNGIDLSGKGGLVWIKNRNDAQWNTLQDTARGRAYALYSNSTSGQTGPDAANEGITSFNSNGFSLGKNNNGGGNTSGYTYASWTFREQPKFFDVVTYTGNGDSFRVLAHSLSSTPGCIIVKRTDSTGNWAVFHRASGGANKLSGFNLNSTFAAQASGDFSGVTDTTFMPANVFSWNGSSLQGSNINGATYVAYLFAHNAGGFGLTGTDNVISCGSYTADGTNKTIELGYEPQWVLVKRATNTGDWWLLDNMRGWSLSTENALKPNTSGEEDTGNTEGNPTATGFYIEGAGNLGTQYAGANQTMIYIAIRRGPMKVPTTGTSVFITDTTVDTTRPRFQAPFPVDMGIDGDRTNGGGFFVSDRLRSGTYLNINTSAETSNAAFTFDFQNGYINSTTALSGRVSWMFRRAPGFFDEVCYTGTGSARTVAHNLGVVPELMIVKSRSSGSLNWIVYNAASGNTKALLLDTTDADFTSSAWNNTTPTSSVFSTGATSGVNNSGATFVAYLFASCPGVSRVGSYTGNGTVGNTVTTGFIPRFIMIKCTTTTGGWLVLDSARGLTSGNDPSLFLNSTAAETTNTDWVTVSSTGFQLNTTGNTSNGAGETYIYLAIA